MFSQEELCSIGTGCPEMFGSHHPCKCPKNVWMLNFGTGSHGEHGSDGGLLFWHGVLRCSFQTLELYDSIILYLFVCTYIHIFCFILHIFCFIANYYKMSSFVVIRNKGILRHPGSVTRVSVAESSHTHGWVTLKGDDHGCCRCYQHDLHTVPLSHDTFSAVDLRAVY